MHINRFECINRYESFVGYWHHSNDYWSQDEGKCKNKRPVLSKQSIKDLWYGYVLRHVLRHMSSYVLRHVDRYVLRHVDRYVLRHVDRMW